LNNKVDYRRDNLLARDVMTSVKDIVCVSDDGWTLERIGELARFRNPNELAIVLIAE
jgi:chloride channel 3/4/5